MADASHTIEETDTERRRRIREAVDKAPPLSAQQCEQLRRIFTAATHARAVRCQ